MYQIKKILFLLLILFISACYEIDMVIELNPDGSGVFKRSMNFNRASEEQKDKIREFMNMPNATFGNELLKVEDNFPEPFFTIIKLDIDKKNLTSYTEIEFQDINRLFAVNKEVSGLKGVSFETDKSHIIFSVIRNKQSSGNTKTQIPLESNPLSALTAKVTNSFISKSNNKKIETFYEFIGDGTNAFVDWQGKLEIPNHSITKKTIKHSFAKYPVLTPSSAEFKTATWVIDNVKSNNSLDLELLLAVPVSKDKTYLGYDQKYLLSGKFNDGKQVSLKKDRYARTDKFNSFRDNFVREGRKFKLPINLSFPQNPVDYLDSLVVRIRVLSVNSTKRFELGKPENGKTYEDDSFKFSVDTTEPTINITSDVPSHLFKQFLIKTPNGNTLPIKLKSTFNKISKFKSNPIIQNSIFIAEYYTDAQYQWLDSKAPRLNFNTSDSRQLEEAFSLEKLFPEITNFPVVDDSIYKDLDSFNNFWAALPDNQVIPALLVVSNNLDIFRKTQEIYSWYQSKLGRSLKEREEFFNNNKQIIADYMFRLFLNKPNQNDNTAILYFTTNLQLSDLLKEQAITAIKEGKLNKGIGIIFRNNISNDDRKVLIYAFNSTTDDWIENKNIFELLSKGDEPDLNLAREVINSDNYHEYVRNSAFEVLLDSDKNISSEFIKPFIINPETRRSAIQVINYRLDKYHSKGEITKDEVIKIIIPLKPVFEDIIKLSDDYDAKNVNTILDAINSVKVEAVL